MPAVARIGDQFTTGHGCTTVSTLTSPSPNVFVDGRGVERKGDPSVSHTIRIGKSCPAHVAHISSGSGSVFINGMPCARVGDSIDNGVIISGSDSVFVGG